MSSGWSDAFIHLSKGGGLEGREPFAEVNADSLYMFATSSLRQTMKLETKFLSSDGQEKISYPCDRRTASYC